MGPPAPRGRPPGPPALPRRARAVLGCGVPAPPARRSPVNRSRLLAAAALAALATGLPSALAVNAAAPLVAGDRLHGNILAPSDADLLTIYLPAGSLFSVDVLAEPGRMALPGSARTSTEKRLPAGR